MLLDVHKTGLRIMETGFFYMPPFPLKYDVENVSIMLNYNKFTKKSFPITASLIFLLSMSSLYVSLTYFLGFRTNADLTMTILQLLSCFSALFAVFLVLLAKSLKPKIPLFNYLLSRFRVIFSRKYNVVHR